MADTAGANAAHGGALDINEVFRGGGRSPEFLDHINQACIVMLAEAGIVPRATAARIAAGIARVMEDARTAAPRRSADYLDYEPRLIAAVGADASRLHSGRSRQDIASTIARMNLRDGVLQEIDALVLAREKALALAAQHTETIVPAYTHGVQAQPTTFAHYLHALAAARNATPARGVSAHQSQSAGCGRAGDLKLSHRSPAPGRTAGLRGPAGKRLRREPSRTGG